MLEWIVTSCFAILAVLVLRAALGERISANLRYALWALVLVRLLVPVQFFTTPMVRHQATDILREESLYILPVQSTPVEDASNIWIEEDGIVDGSSFGYTRLEDGGETFRRYAARVSPLELFGWLWQVGTVVLGIVLLASNLRFAARLRRVRKPLEGAGGPVPVYVAEGLPSPCLFGLFRTAVYVTPQTAADPAMLRHVTAHELTHYRHLDHLWNVLRGAALAVHWWNPLVWLAVTLSRRDEELACDESALRQLGDGERRAYGETLLALVTAKSGPGDLLSFATTMSGGHKSLQERIRRIACKQKILVSASLAAVFLLSLAVVCAFGAKEAEAEDADNQQTAGITEEASVVDNVDPSYAEDHPDDVDSALNELLMTLEPEDLSGLYSSFKPSELARLLHEAVPNRLSRFHEYGSFAEEEAWMWSAAVLTEFIENGGTLYMLACDSGNVELAYETADGCTSAFYESEELYALISGAGRVYPTEDLPYDADLDRDGSQERFFLRSDLDGMYWCLQCVKENGEKIWADYAATSHVGWNALFLCHMDGQDYLLRYLPYMSGGICSYQYQLFYLENGREVVVRENSLEFDINFGKDFAEYHQFEPRAVASFMDEINALLENSIQLLNTDGELLGTFEKEGRLYDSLWWLDDDDFTRDEGKSLLENLLTYRNNAIAQAAVPTAEEVFSEIREEDIISIITSFTDSASSTDVVGALHDLPEALNAITDWISGWHIVDGWETLRQPTVQVTYTRSGDQGRQTMILETGTAEGQEMVRVVLEGQATTLQYSENPYSDGTYLTDVPYSYVVIVKDKAFYDYVETLITD